MSFVSKAQQRYFMENRKRLEAQGVNVSEWIKSTGNKRLPEKVGKSAKQKAEEKLKKAMQ